MVQASKRWPIDDSISECRIHDLLRDVAIQNAKEENFLSVCSNGDWQQSCGWARRVAVHNQRNCSELMENASTKLRTLLCFNSQLPNCAGYKRLKVLSHLPMTDNKVEMTRLEGLSQVRYLKLHQRSVVWDKECFEKIVGSMKFLQTLDLSLSFKTTSPNLEHPMLPPDIVPDCIWHIKTLRHLMLPPDTFNLGLPPSTDLRNLQTLTGVKTQISWEPTTLPNLPNLRLLEIEIIEGFSWDLAADFLKTLEKLKCLTIKRRDKPTQLVDMSIFPFYPELTFLKYWSCFFCATNLEVTTIPMTQNVEVTIFPMALNALTNRRVMNFEVKMFPNHLTALTFKDCELQQCHLEVLEKLPELKILRLDEAYTDRKMKFSAGGFPKLQQLFLTGLTDLEEWKIEKGAMPKLTKLRVPLSKNFPVPLGARYLAPSINYVTYID